MIGNNQYGPPIEMEQELLESLYWGNQYSLCMISELFNTKDSVIHKKMKKYNIPTRKLKESHIYNKGPNSTSFKKGMNKPINAYKFPCGKDHPMKVIVEKELLESLYYGNGFTKSKIAEIFNCSQPTILNRMKEYKVRNREIYPKDKREGYKWELAKWRDAIYKRDDYSCQICCDRSESGNSVELNAHHIKSWREYPEDRFKLENGITLCYDCHKWIHHNNISFSL